MSSAGYSGTSLPQKLGLRPGQLVAIVDAPPQWVATRLVEMPDVELRTLRTRALDLILLFVRSSQRLVVRLPQAVDHLRPTGALWVAWPKKASGVVSDIREGTIRDVALPMGLVDNKVAALDDTWSGLRLVVRVSARDSWPTR